MIDLNKYTAFALYRLPFADEIKVVCQYEECAHSGSRCFIMIPFDEAKHSIIRIVPDIEMKISTAMLDAAEASSDLQIEGDKAAYFDAFARFHSVIPSQFPKLVLSRSVKTTYTDNPLNAFVRACKAYPRTMVYLCYTKKEGYWLGSTPEILLAGAKSHYRTVALAGTMTSEGEWSAKNRHEQAIVADYIRQIVTPLSTVVEEEGPYTSHAGNLLHLKTLFHFSPIPSAKVIDFIDELHPTPAVCGLPKDEAKRFIIQNEGYDRSYYSGVVGMLDTQGETNLYVNLRCCHIQDGIAELYAGGGILEASTAESEYMETEHKLKTIMEVL